MSAARDQTKTVDTVSILEGRARAAMSTANQECVTALLAREHERLSAFDFLELISDVERSAAKTCEVPIVVRFPSRHRIATRPLHGVALSDLESTTADSAIASSNALPDSALVKRDPEK